LNPACAYDALAVGEQAIMANAVELKAPQVLYFGLIRRMPKKGREIRHRREVSSLRTRRKSPDRHVLDHALAQRAGRFVSHGSASVSSEVRKPQISKQDRPARYREFLHASDVAEDFVARLRAGAAGRDNIGSEQPGQIEQAGANWCWPAILRPS